METSRPNLVLGSQTTIVVREDLARQWLRDVLPRLGNVKVGAGTRVIVLPADATSQDVMNAGGAAAQMHEPRSPGTSV